MDVKEIIMMRKRLGLTQLKFAEKLGLHISTIQLWEMGRTQPSPMAIEKLEALRDNYGRLD